MGESSAEQTEAFCIHSYWKQPLIRNVAVRITQMSQKIYAKTDLKSPRER